MFEFLGYWWRVQVWPFVQSFTRGTRRRVVLASMLLLVVVKTVQWFRALTVKQTAQTLTDSSVFLETAAQPFSFGHVFYPKPPLAAIVYRWAGADPDGIIATQEALSLIAWLVLAITVWLVMERGRAKIIGLVVCVAFLLAPLRIGFTGSILSESLNDSVQTLLIAAFIGLVHAMRAESRARTLALGGTVALLATCWLWARDTNAITCIVAVVVVTVWAWRRRRVPRWLLASLGFALIGAVCVILSTRVVPAQPLPLSLMNGWVPEMTTRGSFAVVNNVMIRMLPSQEGREFLAERGMPWSADVEPFVGSAAYASFLSEPRYAPTRTWIAENGASAYVSWLVRHPLRYANEMAADVWGVLGAIDMSGYMALGWRGNEYGKSLMRTFRSTTASPFVLGGLLLLVPLLLLRARRHWLPPMLVVMIASALVGLLASFFGDSIEMARHCWGASQQLLVAAFLAIVIALDGKRAD